MHNCIHSIICTFRQICLHLGKFYLTVLNPDSDGEHIADNTKQFRSIVTIKENLEILFVNNPDVFVAGDLLWYPVQGNNKIRQAPDSFELTDTLEIYRSEGRKFLTPVELDQLRERERLRAEDAIAQLEREKQPYQALLEELQKQGIAPESITNL